MITARIILTLSLSAPFTPAFSFLYLNASRHIPLNMTSQHIVFIRGRIPAAARTVAADAIIFRLLLILICPSVLLFNDAPLSAA